MTTNRTRYASTQIFLHWLTLMLLVVVYVSIEVSDSYPKGAPRDAVRQWHYWSAIAVWVLMWPRLLLRAALTTPPIEPAMTDWQARAASAVHVLLYLFMFVMPLLGWLTLSARGQTAQLGSFILPAILDANKDLAHTLKEFHEAIANFGYLLVAGHAAAALFHHFITRDNTFTRMLPGRGLPN